MFSFLLNNNNPLILQGASGQRQTNIWLSLFLSLAFLFIGGLVFATPVYLVLYLLLGQRPDQVHGPPWQSGAAMAIMLMASFLPVYLLLWLWLRVYEKRLFRSLGLGSTGAMRKLLVGFLVGLGLYCLVLFLLFLPGYVRFQEGAAGNHGLAAMGGVLIMLLGWIVQGPAEEALCRGWLLQCAGRRRPLVGVLFSSVVFAAFHALNLHITPLAILNLLLFGIFAALYALYEGGIWGVSALHIAWNWAQGNLFGIPVSGNPPMGGALLNLTLEGPPLLTGGAFGSEGGLAVTFVLAMSIGAILFLASRRKI